MKVFPPGFFPFPFQIPINVQIIISDRINFPDTESLPLPVNALLTRCTENFEMLSSFSVLYTAVDNRGIGIFKSISRIQKDLQTGTDFHPSAYHNQLFLPEDFFHNLHKSLCKEQHPLLPFCSLSISSANCSVSTQSFPWIKAVYFPAALRFPLYHTPHICLCRMHESQNLSSQSHKFVFFLLPPAPFPYQRAESRSFHYTSDSAKIKDIFSSFYVLPGSIQVPKAPAGVPLFQETIPLEFCSGTCLCRISSISFSTVFSTQKFSLVNSESSLLIFRYSSGL